MALNVEAFQFMVDAWMQNCFGEEISADKTERSHRFIEEALELVQSAGCSKEDVLILVDYVYGRKEGRLHQEVGGVMVTLSAFCEAHGIRMGEAAYDELQRIWLKIDQIREKQRTKPKASPLPQHTE